LAVKINLTWSYKFIWDIITG